MTTKGFLQFAYKNIHAIILTALSLITHFVAFGYPAAAVFDEVYFFNFISYYFTHQYYFDIHPPFAKLLLGGIGYLVGIDLSPHVLSIGDSFSNPDYLLLRFIPTLAGVFLPIVIYYLARELKFTQKTSFLIGLFIVFESSLLVQSRFVLLDSLLLLFGFGGLLLQLIAHRARTSRTSTTTLRVLAVVSLTLALSIKWTGAAFMALALLVELYTLYTTYAWPRTWIKRALLYSLLPFTLYFSFFAIHFALLTKSGPGDAFMTVNFQRTLTDNKFQDMTEFTTPNIFQKFIELNDQMYRSNKTLTATHPYGSPWYTWPIMLRPIYYWYGSTDQQTNAYIYLIGNIVIYALSTLSIVLLFVLTIFTRRFRTRASLYVLCGYLISYLPFIGISRVMFLYHYSTALIFAILAYGIMIDALPTKYADRARYASAVLAILCFLYFTPIIYGLHLQSGSEAKYFWLKSWR